MERDKMLDVALAQVEKQYGRGAIMRLGEHPMGQGVSVIPTGSLALDLALGIGGAGVVLILKVVPSVLIVVILVLAGTFVPETG